MLHICKLIKIFKMSKYVGASNLQFVEIIILFFFIVSIYPGNEFIVFVRDSTVKETMRMKFRINMLI